MSTIFSLKNEAGIATEKKTGDFLLLIGRWHGITLAQEAALKEAVAGARLDERKLVFVMTASDKGGSKRHPLYADERRQLLDSFANSWGREHEIYEVLDTNEKDSWPEYIAREITRQSKGLSTPNPRETVLVSANPDVIARYQASAYEQILKPETKGATPADLLSAFASGADWKALSNESTRIVYEQATVAKRIAHVFQDVLLNESGELSNGRDFATYAAGMDASTKVKLSDICPWILPGKIVDKGCGTGSLLVHLSELFAESEIVGMDLSRELLHLSESKHYPNHNVAVLKGNIIQQRFRQASLTTVIFSSVMHEVYSYNGYDREQIRLALRNTHKELVSGGRIIIRDGIKPDHPQKMVWMRLIDQEHEERFRRFAREFKGKSSKPGVEFKESVHDGKTHFFLSLHDANEFLSKKDYLANWAIEVNEEFGVFTVSQWRSELVQAGYRVLESSSYLNGWIETNRYNDHAWLYKDDGGIPAKQALPYPDTTAVLVAEKIG